MFLFKSSLILIFFLIPKILLASQWIEGNKLVIQGLDKITARIQSFEVNVGESHRFGVLDIYVERCGFSKWDNGKSIVLLVLACFCVSVFFFMEEGISDAGSCGEDDGF